MNLEIAYRIVYTGSNIATAAIYMKSVLVKLRRQLTSGIDAAVRWDVVSVNTWNRNVLVHGFSCWEAKRLTSFEK